MKNKFLILNIVSYVILYHIVYESIYYFFIDKRSIGATPIGFIISHSNPFRKSAMIVFMISFIINMSVSGILLNYFYKWKNKRSTEGLFGMLCLVFIIVSVLLLIVLFLVMYLFKALGVSIIISLYLPMPIMVVLMVPLFKFNQWIIERLWK